MEDPQRQHSPLPSKAKVVLGLMLLCGVVLTGALWGMPGRLPIGSAMQSPMYLDRYAQPIQQTLSVSQEYGKPLSLSDIPLAIQQMFVVSEDRRFYDHGGVDAKAVLRAFGQMIRGGSIASGASTITMQLARITWPALRKKRNKLAQMIQAVRLEKNHSKQALLERYLNTIPFAHQVVGVAQACTYFYNKTCDRLSLGQMASLAVLPRNPSLYTHDLQKLQSARRSLLEAYQERFPVDATIYEQAKQEQIAWTRTKPEYHARHFIDYISTNHSSGNVTPTTLDMPLQITIQNLLQSHIEKNPGMGDAGAVIVIDNATSSVLAYVSGPEYFQENHGMVDFVQTQRSPGSALKPILYALALEKGWTLSSMLSDMPTHFGANHGTLTPGNYAKDFSGVMQLRYALANSKNIPALVMAEDLGVTAVLEFFRRAGLDSLTLLPEHYGVGLALGNGEVSLWELALAYHRLAIGGQNKNLQWLLPLDQHAPKQIWSPETSFLITDALQDPRSRQEEFGRYNPLTFDFPVAVKTGTSNDYRDHWTMGYSSRYTVGLWKGNADGSPMRAQQPSVHNLGRLFHSVMQHLHADHPGQSFAPPGSIVRKKVCSLSGQTMGSYCKASRWEYFHLDHQPTHVCSLHQAKIVDDCGGQQQTLYYTAWPDQISPWVKSTDAPTLSQVYAQKCGGEMPQALMDQSQTQKPHFTHPLNETVYAMDPRVPKSHQSIRLSWENTTHPSMKLWINDVQQNHDLSGGYMDWPMQPGKHRFEIRQNQTIVAKTVITVR